MSELTDFYPTGTDYNVYLSDPLTAGDGVLPDFSELTPLDVSSFTIQEDGQVVPLYDVSQRTPDHFAYSRRMINGSLRFNYSEQFAEEFRTPLQSIRGKTFWVRLTYTDWQPLRHVRDTFRIPDVYEHTFRHSAQPQAVEEVPFSGRDLTLVEREIADLNADIFADFAREEDQQFISASDVFRERKQRHLATVTKVEDGDTLTARIDSTQKEVQVRLAGVDTPEVPGKRKTNPTQDRNAAFRWPASAPETPTGKAGRPPTKEQMDKWGIFVREQVRNWLPKGSKIWLVTDQGTAPRGAFERFVFRVDVPKGLPGANGVSDSTNLGKHLVKMGYASPYRSDSIYLNENNHYRSLSKIVDDLAAKAEDRAGQNDAAGIWYSFDPDDWKAHANL